MSQTIGRTRLAYSRAWHHLSLSPLSPIWRTTPPSNNAASANTTQPTTTSSTSASPTTQTTSLDPWSDYTTPPPLGRIASRISLLLMGKHKPIYDPSTDCGDYVVVTGCHELRVTGAKLTKKKYYSHTTRPGSLKEVSMERLMEKWGGGEVLRRAVKGMLPKNKLQDKRLERLRCFEGEAHPYRENFVRFAADEPTRRELRAAGREVGLRVMEPPGREGRETRQAEASV